MAMQKPLKLPGGRGPLIRVAAAIAVLLAGSRGDVDILNTSAAVRPNNALLVDVQVTTGANVERVSITSQTIGGDPNQEAKMEIPVRNSFIPFERMFFLWR
jgi:hypothetical protein